MSAAPLHIVQVANFYGPRSGGLRTCLQALGRGYLAAGHHFSAVVPGEQDARLETDFGTVYTVASPVVRLLGDYRVIVRTQSVRRLLEQLGPDRLEVSDRSTLHGLGTWARQRGVPTVFFAHERLDGVLASVGIPAGPARRLADLRNRRTATSFGQVVATTSFAAVEFERIGATNVRRVPLGVDLSAQVAVDSSRVPASGRNRTLELLVCSRLSVEKQVELAVRALIVLRRRGVDAHLTVVGDGPQRQRLERLAAGHPVRFLGFVTDRAEVAARQRAADIALAPGPIETFGLAALECLAAGTPVVVNAASALPEVIGDDPAVGRAASGDPESFADAVLTLAAAGRSTAARARAEQFPWSRTIDEMLSVHRIGSELRA
ncbi:glycosyltransferase [Nakamurella sp. A5-74]|uniref:Glycosyltransferase n=1 Tax=Nakamurella sp. A5-74 TaxID=3158264 RepID=A0AAU8DMD6_9ACTN